VLFYFTKRTRKFVLGGVIGFILAAVAVAFGPSRMAMLSVEEASAYNRMDLWYQGMQMLKHNPLFGVGYNMFQDQLAQTAHNSFVLAAAELGFFGLFFFVGLLYVSFKELSLVQKSDVALKSYALGIQSALVGFSAAAFFLSRTYIILPYMFFALAGALFFIARQRNKKIAFNFAMKDARNTAVLCLGVLLLVVIATKIGL
jgi:putative inorganic carbon (HCO3(-)) transporter